MDTGFLAGKVTFQTILTYKGTGFWQKSGFPDDFCIQGHMIFGQKSGFRDDFDIQGYMIFGKKVGFQTVLTYKGT